MVDVPDIGQDTIDAAVDNALASVLPTEASHLARAVIAARVAAVANHRSHSEVAAAHGDDSASWDDVGHAFGISPHTAEQRFRTAPMGLAQ